MIILLIIIIIFIVLLFGIRIRVQWMKLDNDYNGCAKILIFKRLKVYTFDFKSDDDESDEEAEEDEEDTDEPRDLKKIYELAKPCFGDLKTFFHEFLNAVNVNKLENYLVIGFSNFTKTGECIGYIWAVLAVLNTAIPNARLQAQPSFQGEVLNLKGSLNIDISVLKLVVPALKLISKKEIRALIRGVRNG